MALVASSGSSLLRQSRCPSGHSRLKHGEQVRDSVKILALLDKGGVNPGSDEP